MSRADTDAPQQSGGYDAFEPDIIDSSMTARDVVYVLRNLNFRRGGLARLRIDRGIAEYFIGRLPRAARRAD